MAKRKKRRAKPPAGIEGGASAYGAPAETGRPDETTERADDPAPKKTTSTKPDAVTDEELQAILKADYDAAVSYTDQATQASREQGINYYHAEPFGDEEEGRSSAIATEVRDTIRMMLPQVIEIFCGGERTVEYMPIGPEDVDLAELATAYVNNIVLELDNPGFDIFHAAFKDAMREKLGFVKWWWQQNVEVITEDYTGLSQAEVGLILEDGDDVELIKATMTIDAAAGGDGDAAMPPLSAQPPVSAAAALSNSGSAGAAAAPPTIPGAPPLSMMPPGIGPGMMAAPPGAGMPPAPQLPVPVAPAPAPAELSFDITVKRTVDKSYLALAAVPPEEMLIVPNSRDWRGSTTIIHKTTKTVSELVAMGYAWDDVIDLNADDDTLETPEQQARDPASTGSVEAERSDPASKRVQYCEMWIRVDRNGDGVAELKRICTGGTELRVLAEEETDQVNVAAFPIDPEPHTPWALSIADLTADLQFQKSHMWRAAIDSLANSVSPRLGFVEGQVNEADILTNENSAPIRMRAPGMIQPITVPFVGGDALTMMAYADDVREQRTGVTKAAAGLDPDTMQSTTLAAVNATISAAQTQIRMVARIFGEFGMKPLFRGILRTLKNHTVKPRMVRLLGRWVQVDPRDWSDYDVSVEVALGRGSNPERIAALSQIAAKQEQVLATLGPDNPLCGLGEYRYTLAKMVELAGFKDAARFFKPILPSEGQQPQGKGQDQQDPAAQALITTEQIKQQSAKEQKAAQLDYDWRKAEAEIALRAEQARRDDDFRRDQLEVETTLKIAELQAKYGTTLNIAQIKAMVDRDREASRANSAKQAAAMSAAAKANGAAQKQTVQ